MRHRIVSASVRAFFWRLILHWRPAGRFLGPVEMLGIEHPRFRPTAASPFLSADLLDAGLFGSHKAVPYSFNLVEEQLPSEESVEPLVTAGLTLDLDSCRTVTDHDAGCRLVHVLAAVSTGPHKLLL